MADEIIVLENSEAMAETEEVKLVESNESVSNLDLVVILGELFGVESKINECQDSEENRNIYPWIKW